MAKTEVYSWRLSPALKQRLAEAARSEGTSLAGLLERIAAEWIDRHADPSEEERQRAIRETALPCIGALAGGDPARSRRARERFRQKLGSRQRARSP